MPGEDCEVMLLLPPVTEARMGDDVDDVTDDVTQLPGKGISAQMQGSTCLGMTKRVLTLSLCQQR